MTKQMSFDDYVHPDFTSFLDGLCEPSNPRGVATYGLVVYDNKGTKVHEESKFVGKGDGTSNNVAEYSGLVALLEYLIQNDVQGNISVRLDPKLVVKQVILRKTITFTFLMSYLICLNFNKRNHEYNTTSTS